MIQKSAKVLLFNGVEELEASAPITLLKRAGIEVQTLSMGPELWVEGKQGIGLRSDALFSHNHEEADLIVLPGGPGVLELLDTLPLHAWIRQHADAGKFIGAICAAPLLLETAGLLDEVPFTAHHSVHSRFARVPLARKWVRSGNIITASGAGSAIDFGLELIEALMGEIVRERVVQEVEFSVRAHV